MVPTESADAHESIERVEVVISRAQALEMIRQRNPKTHTPEGALIVYKIDPSSFTQSARYRSNADPSYNGEQ